MKAWLATQIERIESVPEYDYDDSGQHLYVIGPDDQTDFAYVVREAYIRAAKHGCNAPPPDAMLTKPDALYALRSLLAWLDGHEGDEKPAPDVMLSIQQAARILGCSVSGLRKLITRNAITFYQDRKGAPIKFRREWLDEFIDNGTPETPVGSSTRSATHREFDPDVWGG